MSATTSGTAGTAEDAGRLARESRSLYRAIPLYLAVPVAFWAAMRASGIAMDWRLAGLGALGWWVALLLRAPLALLVRRMPEARGRRLVVAASGPVEEGVRAVAVLLLSPGLAGALSLGLGWASIEVGFAVVNGLVVVRLLRGGDERAARVREALEAQGTLSVAAPWLGVVERVFATLLHVGFTLVVAAAPVLALLTAPIHSAVNLLAVRLLPRMGRVLAMLAAAGVAVTAWGLAMMR